MRRVKPRFRESLWMCDVDRDQERARRRRRSRGRGRCRRPGAPSSARTRGGASRCCPRAGRRGGACSRSAARSANWRRRGVRGPRGDRAVRVESSAAKSAPSEPCSRLHRARSERGGARCRRRGRRGAESRASARFVAAASSRAVGRPRRRARRDLLELGADGPHVAERDARRDERDDLAVERVVVALHEADRIGLEARAHVARRAHVVERTAEVAVGHREWHPRSMAPAGKSLVRSLFVVLLVACGTSAGPGGGDGGADGSLDGSGADGTACTCPPRLDVAPSRGCSACIDLSCVYDGAMTQCFCAGGDWVCNTRIACPSTQPTSGSACQQGSGGCLYGNTVCWCDATFDAGPEWSCGPPHPP